MNRYLVIGHMIGHSPEHDYIHAKSPEQAKEYFENKIKIRQLCDGHPLPDVYTDYIIAGDNVRLTFPLGA